MKFSITIPAYKGRYLYEAIESVLAQTYKDFELVIVDDCSPENLKDIVDKFHDSRIRFFRNEKNCGAVDVVDNWNICLSYCQGEYVICMGDDDRLKPCCLEHYNDLITKYPSLEVYHAWTDIIDENGLHKRTLAIRPEYESVSSLIFRRMNGDSQFIGDFCYNLKKLKNYGGYYKLPLAWCSDDITSYRAALNGGIANTQEICFEYRMSSLTISNNESLETIQLKIQSLLHLRSWLEYNISQIKKYPINDENDIKYNNFTNNYINTYISKEIAYWAIKDIKSNRGCLLYWMKYFLLNKLSVKTILREYFSFLYHKWLKKIKK